MPIAAKPMPVLRPRPRPLPLPVRVPIREACVLIGNEVLSLDEWTSRRPSTATR